MSPSDGTQKQPTSDVEQLYRDLKNEVAEYALRTFSFAALFLCSLRLIVFYFANQSFRSGSMRDLFSRASLSLAAIAYPVIIIVLLSRQMKKGYRLFRAARFVKRRIKAELPKED